MRQWWTIAAIMLLTGCATQPTGARAVLDRAQRTAALGHRKTVGRRRDGGPFGSSFGHALQDPPNCAEPHWNPIVFRTNR
jgi:protein gp37